MTGLSMSFRQIATALVLPFAVLMLCSTPIELRAQQQSPGQQSKTTVARRHSGRRSVRRKATHTAATTNTTAHPAADTPPSGIVIGNRDIDAPPTTGAENRSSQSAPTPHTKTIISGGILNGKALSKPQPVYPPIAKAARAQGTVVVQILVDEKGDVISASAVSGHPLLQQAAVQAARLAKFTPTLLSGQPVKVSGVITYNFVLLDDTRPKA